MAQEKIIKMTEAITVNELANNLNIPVGSLIGELFKNGIVATINQKIDFETVEIILSELGITNVTLEKVALSDDIIKRHKLSENAEDRPPIVAVMGHVDHGKTTLLDYLLKTKAVEKEAGGITQYISAYQTKWKGKSVTFLDTPGHEAFAAVRQHGACLTDLVIIVVAADDGVKPQTVEAIKFAQSANAKIIVAINKIDKTTADINRVMSQLSTDHHLSPEEWGGDTIMVPISAKTGQGIDDLMEAVFLVAEMEELKADYDVDAEGLVIESKIEHGRGPVVRLLVQQGGLKVGDFIVAGEAYGKVRTMVNHLGKPMRIARPSTPVTVTGFKSLPQFGQLFVETKTEKEAKQLANNLRIRNQESAASSNITSGDLLKMMKQFDEAKNFNVVIKTDVEGSLTSVIDSLKLIDAGSEIKLNIVESRVGDITENDIRRAVGDNTIIYGFNVSVSSAMKQLAARLGVSIRIYKVIYELIDDVKSEMEKLLSPEIRETEVGRLKVKGVFKIARNELVLGGLVTSGQITSGLVAKIMRKRGLIAEAEVMNVQKNQQDAKDVIEGDMCGMLLKTHGKVAAEIGDQIIFVKREVLARKIK
ncbi:MAG: translation initiation factor IF-2 [Candidatus Nanosyncoccaceae bacterium]|jgi:translation initiation factor IF-2